MSPSSEPEFRLATTWSPSTEGEASRYTLALTNRSADHLSGFRLCISGPARIDQDAPIDGGELVERLSNHSELAPPDGFVLAPGETWTVVVRGLKTLRHWTDGATGAYLLTADGATRRVALVPTVKAGDATPLLRGVEVYPVPTRAPVPISVVPWPRNVSVTGGRAAPAGLALEPSAAEADRAAEAFRDLTRSLFPAEAIVRPAAEGGLPVSLSLNKALGAEAYAIEFAQSTAKVTAGARTGLLYGLVTLGHIFRGARRHPETFLFPSSGEIRDEPAFAWRGTHLDVARQFYATDEVLQFLRILAWNKLNRFHWHLSDDEAWRVEVDAYPELVKVGAWRGHGRPIPSLLGSAAEASGGYYTKGAVREVVAEAARLGIEVVPEIDLPGHCYAMLQALPHLRDPQERGSTFSVQGFPNNCLNPAREETYAALQAIFEELIPLFPFKTIHVGADEVPLGAWSGSPQALAMLRALAGADAAESHARRLDVLTNLHGADEIEDSGAAVLQAEFLRRVQGLLTARGCTTGAWEEAAHGDVLDKTRCYLTAWRSVESSAALAARGYDVVVCPGQVYYLDMAMSEDWSEPGAGWAGSSSAQELYGFEPGDGWIAAQRERLMGIQSCIWSEPMTDRAVFDRLVFPRISALAETGWTRREAKSWERFKALAGLMPILYGR